jgi:hypothetical protein
LRYRGFCGPPFPSILPEGNAGLAKNLFALLMFQKKKAPASLCDGDRGSRGSGFALAFWEENQAEA